MKSNATKKRKKKRKKRTAFRFIALFHSYGSVDFPGAQFGSRFKVMHLKYISLQNPNHHCQIKTALGGAVNLSGTAASC